MLAMSDCVSGSDLQGVSHSASSAWPLVLAEHSAQGRSRVVCLGNYPLRGLSTHG
jgi:hypothetical protein